jgi:hypothetical protein
MAACFDIGQAILSVVTFELSDIVDILVIDPLITVLFWFIFYFFLKVNFTRTRALVFFGLAFLEFIPVVDEFPLWVIDVIAVIMMVAAEDRIPALKKLDQAVKTNKFGFGNKITNTAELKAGMNPREMRTMKRVSGVIINAAGQVSGKMPGGMGRQNFNGQVAANERGQKIAAQKERKVSANPPPVINAQNSFNPDKNKDEKRMAA